MNAGGLRQIQVKAIQRQRHDGRRISTEKVGDFESAIG